MQAHYALNILLNVTNSYAYNYAQTAEFVIKLFLLCNKCTSATQ